MRLGSARLRNTVIEQLTQIILPAIKTIQNNLHTLYFFSLKDLCIFYICKVYCPMEEEKIISFSIGLSLTLFESKEENMIVVTNRNRLLRYQYKVTAKFFLCPVIS